MDDIFRAIMSNDLGKVKEFIQNKENINIIGKCEATPLMFAAIFGRLEIVKYLVQSGANLNILDINEMTALMHATNNSRLKIVKYLIWSGADPNITTHPYITNGRKFGGWSALIYAKSLRNSKLIACVKYYPIYLAAMRRLIPRIAPQISLTSCARISEFM